MEQWTGSKLEKEYSQGSILSPCLFNFYAEYIMWNARLYEAQAGIKISGRSINNITYADDITLMAESEEELKSLLMKVKEESEKTGLNSTSFKKLKIVTSDLTTSWHIDGGNVEMVSDSFARLMLKLKLQYFGYLMRRADSLEKTLMLGKTEGKWWQRMIWLNGITHLMGMSLRKLNEILMDREAWHAAVHGRKELDTS